MYCGCFTRYNHGGYCQWESGVVKSCTRTHIGEWKDISCHFVDSGVDVAKTTRTKTMMFSM
jgi:hypothetical protein